MDILPPGLIDTWDLDQLWVQRFNERESAFCMWCASALRVRHMAATVVAHFNVSNEPLGRSFSALCDSPGFRELRIAEINACGQLHRFLLKCPNLAYSEFLPSSPKIRHEDILDLTYRDCTFELCLTSDTLEHVPDIRRALTEIRRILVPAGRHIFTIPVVWDRPQSRVRAVMESGGIRHIYRPSFHGCGSNPDDYLVFTEFGQDVVNLLASLGFATSIIQDPQNPAVTTFVTTRLD
jgi:SAM-dependent methyltransferase